MDKDKGSQKATTHTMVRYITVAVFWPEHTDSTMLSKPMCHPNSLRITCLSLRISRSFEFISNKGCYKSATLPPHGDAETQIYT